MAESESDVKIPAELHKLAKESTESFQCLVDQSSIKGQVGDKAKSILVTQWLLDSFIAHPTNSIPRSVLYDQYSMYCQANGIACLNPASFGKLLRIVFPDIKTRRLGNRGMSKYHYCGIRVRTQEFNPLTSVPFSPFPTMNSLDLTTIQVSDAPIENQDDRLILERISVENGSVKLSEFILSLERDRGEIDILLDFTAKYHPFCQEILNRCQWLKFEDLEFLMTEFWSKISKEEIKALETEAAQEEITKFDLILYESIRGFSKNIESWVYHALQDHLEDDSPLLEAKATALSIFITQLKRHTSLNYLCQSVQPILESTDIIQSLILEWNRCDFVAIRDQATWITDCHSLDLLRILEIDIRTLLVNHSKLYQWIQWIETTTHKCIDHLVSLAQEQQCKLNNDGDTVLTSDEPGKMKILAESCKKFVLNWNFIGGLVMRDFTFKSSHGLGALHMIKMFMDEYVYHVTEKRLVNINYTEQVSFPCIL